MKAAIKKTSLTSYPFGASNLLQPDEQQNHQMTSMNLTLNHTFAEQQIAPPAHVWEKIAGILDAQDRQKALARETPQLNSAYKGIKSLNLLWAGAACLVLAVVMWMVY